MGALGTLAVKSATYITLPEKVEAAVQKNTEQDGVLNQLGTIADQNQKLLDKWDGIYQQQQQVPNQAMPRMREWRDPDTGQWWCCAERTGCERDENWERCE